VYFGPLRWPPLWVWLAAAALATLFAVLALLGISVVIPMVIAVVAILIVAGPRRASDLGADEMRDSRPDE
jgi:hypothetical protein